MAWHPGDPAPCRGRGHVTEEWQPLWPAGPPSISPPTPPLSRPDSSLLGAEFGDAWALSGCRGPGNPAAGVNCAFVKPSSKVELSLAPSMERVFGRSTVCVPKKSGWKGTAWGGLYTPETKETQTKGVPEAGWVSIALSATFYIIYFPVLFDNFY